MAEPIIPVQPPRRRPRTGGITTVAEVIDGQDRIATNGSVAFVSPGCTLPETIEELCLPPEAEKTRSGVDTIDGLGGNFALYSGVECFLGGEDYERAATDLLEQGEDRGLENVLRSRAADRETAISTGATLSDALAAAEAHADQNYIGEPILMVGRDGAVLLDDQGSLKRDDEGVIRTVNGTPVVASGSDSTNVIAFGAIAIHRSGIASKSVIDHLTNREFAIAERAYALAVDCGYIAIHTTTTGA